MPDRRQDRGSPHRRFTDERGEPAGSIGVGVTVEGSFRSTDDCELWGTFRGEMEIEGLLRIRPDALVAGEVVATDVVVEGALTGSLRATGKVDLRAGCRVEADITAARVVAAEGNVVEGQIEVTGEPAGVVSYPERRRR